MNILKSPSRYLVNKLIKFLGPVIHPVGHYMAKSGVGTEGSLKKGYLPVSVHYYQPIPDIGDLRKRDIWNKVSDLPGIKFEPEAFLQNLRTISRDFAAECEWSNEKSADPRQFHLANDNFSYGCAAPLHCAVRHYKSKRIIEIGSGNSSRVIAGALVKNRQEGHQSRYTIIDPYSRLETANFPEGTEIIRERVELCDPALFTELGENDILFIDSSHVSKIGSDVNFEILEILPRLKKGVIVHVHDVCLPYEYPRSYSENPAFRVFWNEAYLLQAFLSGNTDFEILIPMFYLQKHFLPELNQLFPHSAKAVFGWQSGSFWIHRVSDSTKH